MRISDWSSDVCSSDLSDESVRMCIRHGVEIIYHASYASDETIDMLAAQKDKFFVGPGLGWLINTARNAGKFGITPESQLGIYYEREAQIAIETMSKMHRTAIRVQKGRQAGRGGVCQKGENSGGGG